MRGEPIGTAFRLDVAQGGFAFRVLRWSEALSGIARTGLGFTESLYEKERFEEILHIAADMKVAVNEGGLC